MHFEKRVTLKKRLPARVKNPLEQPTEFNVTWSMDFVSDVLECGRKFRILYTQPGCPTQNGYIERYNGTYRRAILDQYIFKTIGQVREKTDEWIDFYNNKRPHESLDNMTPMEYRNSKNEQDD